MADRGSKSRLASLKYGRRASPINLKKSDNETNSLPGAGIQLNDRQRKLLAARKGGGGNGNGNGGGTTGSSSLKEQNHALPPTKTTMNRGSPMLSSYGGNHKGGKEFTSKSIEMHRHQYLGDQPTHTAETLPNTFSEDSSSSHHAHSRTAAVLMSASSTGAGAGSNVASSNNGSNNSRTATATNNNKNTLSSLRSLNNVASQFYGQRLEGKEKKLYDDTGVTWNDSQSEAEASHTSSAASSAVSNRLSSKVASVAAAAASSSSAVGGRGGGGSKVSTSSSRMSSRTAATTSTSAGSLSRLKHLQFQRQNGGNNETRSVVSGITTASSSIALSEARSSISSSSSSVASAAAASTVVAASKAGSGISSSSSVYSKYKSKQQQQQQQQDNNDKASVASSSSSFQKKQRQQSQSIIESKVEESSLHPLHASSSLKQQDKEEEKPLAFHTQKDKDTFLRRTMMQWAKPSSSSSSSSENKTSTTKSVLKSSSTTSSSSIIMEHATQDDDIIQNDPSGEIPTTNSQVQQRQRHTQAQSRSTTSKSSSKSNNSRRISWVPKKTIIPNRSPRRGQPKPMVSPKERAAMKKVADRNSKNSSNNTSFHTTRKKTSPTSAISATSNSSGSNNNPRRAAGKMIKSTSSRMKKFMSSSTSLSSSSSSLKEDEEEREQSNDTNDVNVGPDDEYDASIVTPRSRDRRPIELEQSPVLEEMVDGDQDDNTMMRNRRMRKKSTRGRSSIFKRKLGGMVMGVMDDLIEENDELSSDDDESEYESVAEYELEDEIKKARSIRSQTRTITNDDEIEIKISSSTDSEQKQPNINTIIDENKEFLHTMREGPLKQAKLLTSASSSLNAISESYDEETEEYRNFADTLKSELASSHVNTYDSFYAMFREDGNLPTKSLSVYPGSLDLKSKEAISSMSKYLTGKHNVECLIGSQIMKDKNQHTRNNHHHNNNNSNSNSNSVNNGSSAQSQNNQIDEYGSIRLVSSTDSINEGQEGSDYEVTLGQHNRKGDSSVAIPFPSGSFSFDSSNDSRYLDTKKTKLGRSSSIFKLPPTAAGESVPFTSVKLRSRSPVSDNQNKTGTSSFEEEQIPNSWTKVRLRTIVKTDQQKNDSNGDSNVKEFHRIVLKRTPTNACGGGGGPKKNFDMSLDTAPSSLTDVSGTDKKPIDIERAGNSEGQPIKLTETRGSQNIPIKISPMSGTEGKPIEVIRKGGADNPIKLAPSTGGEYNPITLVQSTGGESHPIEMAPSIDLDLNEGSVMVSLVNEDSSGICVDMNVIVGKNGITKVQSIQGQTTKANVIWRIERGNVKSALLDMSLFHVKVIVASDSNVHKDLYFPSSAQCMRFANALHEMKNITSKTNGSGNSSLASINENRTTPGSDDSSVYVEQLSDEEQKILGEFRQRKKNNDQDGCNSDSNGKDFMKELLSKNLLTKNGEPSIGTKPMSVVNADTIPSSPMSEVSIADSALSPNESKTAFKYQLMLKMMKAPKEEVKRKMEEDQVDRKIMEFVLGESLTKPPSSSSSCTKGILSPAEEKTASTYRKMLKMRIDPEAVGHRMKKDGVSQKIVSAVLGGGGGDANEGDQTTTKPDPPPSINLTISEQAAAQTYKKMLKMCIPKEAVEHKMKKDGVDPKIVAFVLGVPAAVPAAGSTTTSSLTKKEESIATIYRKMLKMSIPKEAVHHKMKKDGVSEKIIAALSLGENKTKVPIKTTQKKRGGFKAGFHWSPIADDESIVGSVWSKTKTASETGAKQLPAIDIFKHVEQFQKQPDKALEKKKKAAKSGSGSKEMAKLIDLNRANNVAITLKAFNDFSHKELSQMIEFLDPFGKITGDRALFMKDLLPNIAEVKAIKSYIGGDNNLVTAERWFKKIVHIKRIEIKIQVMRTIETFQMDAIVLGKSFQLLTTVCNQVMDSDRLPDLLDMVRQVGNRMNEGRGDEAVGFKLDFLSKLAQTKGSDKKTTALDLVVLIFCTRNERGALALSGDFPDIQEASRVQFSDLTTDVRNLEGSFRKCRKEFDTLQKEHEAMLLSGSRIDVNSEAVGKKGGLEKNVNLSLHDAIKARSNPTKEDPPSVSEVLTAIQKSTTEQRNSLSPRSSLMATMEEKNNCKIEFSLEASIRRLEKFVGEVNYIVLPKLESDRLAAVEACKDLASFFCESGGEKVASNLLKILGGFAAGIDQAVKKHDEKQMILNRKEAVMKKKKIAAASSSKSSASCATMKGGSFLKMGNSNYNKAANERIEKESKQNNYKRRPSPETASNLSPAQIIEQGEKKSLVLMVNEMLKVAGDKEIEDFMQGRVNDKPDNRLKKIYEAEQLRTTSDRDNILSSIRKRRSISTNPIPQQALSDLHAKLEDTRDEVDSVHVSKEKKYDANNNSDGTGNGSGASGRRKSQIAARWTSKDPLITTEQTDSEILSSLSHDTDDGRIVRPRGRKSRVVDRWSSKKVEKERVSNTKQNNSSNRNNGSIINNIERTDSEILTSVSQDTQEVKISQRRRQSYMNRWASKSPVSEASTKDLDEESDIGVFQETIKKRRQKAINRWSSKPPVGR